MMRRRLLKYLEILFAATLAIAGAASGDVDPASVSFTEPSTTDPPMNWHTFIGGPVSFDSGSAVVLDSAGNVFVAGSSMTSWGVPLNPYSGMTDIVVAKFDASGRLQWHTFLGGSSGDDASDLAVDDAGNLFLVGSSEASWGTPLNPHADDNHSDIVVAKLDIAGRLQWNTFVGGSLSDWSGSLSVDSVGDLFIAGQSHGSWGAPLNPHAGDSDLLVAKLDAAGWLQWHTFLGAPGYDSSSSVVLDDAGNPFVAGTSREAWGTPLDPFADLDGNYPGVMADILVAKLDPAGRLRWHSFFGGWDDDYPSDLAIDAAGNLFLTGASLMTWGTPLNPHSGAPDIVVVKLAFDQGSDPSQLVVSPNEGFWVFVDSDHRVQGPTVRTYRLRNPGGAALEYRIATTAPWVDLDPTEGLLETGGETPVTLTVNENVHALAPNQLHQAQVRFDNLGDGTGNTARTVSALMLAGAEPVWGISTTEGFDDNSSLAAVDLPPDSTNVLRIQVDQGPVPVGGTDTPALDPERNLVFQLRSAIGPQDRVTVSVAGEPVDHWAGTNGWEPVCVPLTSCPGFPCEVSFAVSVGPETPMLQGNRAVYIDNMKTASDVCPIAALLPASRSAQVGNPVTAFATLINTGTEPGLASPARSDQLHRSRVDSPTRRRTRQPIG